MKRIIAAVLSVIFIAIMFTGCAPKILHCDRCGVEVKVEKSSNMEEDWIIYCAECNVELFGEDGLVSEYDGIVGEVDNSISYDFEGFLCSSIAVSKMSDTSTAVIYTIITNTDADYIEIWNFDTAGMSDDDINAIINQEVNGEILNSIAVDDSKLTDVMTVDEVSGKNYTAAKNVQDDQVTWTIQWDLETIDIRLLQINIVDDDAGKAQLEFIEPNLA